ncbi:MAG: hypothetical protein COA74_01980 [Gammaproteobacteria bacterium]|nr:MAG: hypothetical protein COA74_15765 [Gammaproteobacteria bacterium]PCJ50570.1 MAG: hypothetical protein COA74_01980 [Gammaproteobacteria bacterium]
MKPSVEPGSKVINQYFSVRDLVSFSDFSLGSWQVFPSNKTIKTTSQVIELEPKMMLLLCVLAEANGKVVSRKMLFDKVWGEQVVGDNALSTSISILRNHLKDDLIDEYIKTKPKLGYQINAPITWLKPQNNQRIPNNLYRRRKWKIGLSVILLFFLLGTIAYFIQPFTVNIPSDKQYSIAVLPLDNFSKTAEYNFFANGLTEQIIHQLASVTQFKVISRTSSSRFKNSPLSLKDIAKKLNVNYLIEGSIQKDKDFLVTIQLIDARTDFHLWSKEFRATDARLFELQKQIGEAVAGSFGLNEKAFSKNLTPYHPAALGAYQSFLKAQTYANLGGAKNLQQSLMAFKKATELAPDYALAHAGIATVSLLLYQRGILKPKLAFAQATTHINSAIKLNPNLAQAFAARGLMYTYRSAFDSAESNYKRALAINPRLTIALHNFGFLLWSQHRYEQSLPYFIKTLEYNPLAPMSHFAIGDTLTNLGKIDDAIKSYEYCLTILPKNTGCLLGLAFVYRTLNNMAQADQLVKKANAILPKTDPYLLFAKILNLQANGLWNKATDELDRVDVYYSDVYVYKRAKMMENWLQVNSNSALILKLNNHSKSDRHILLPGAHSFWQNDCINAIKHYESMYLNKPELFSLIDDYGVGISHELNLAYCYQITEQKDKSKENLAKAWKNITGFTKDPDRVPGLVYAKARYFALIGEAKRSQTLLDSNKLENWSWNKLRHTDPIFSHLIH